jgi:hypothetical protein
LWLALSVSCGAAHLETKGVGRTNITLRPGVTCLDDARLHRELELWLPRAALPAELQIDVQGSVHDPRSVLVRLYASGKEVARRSFAPGPASCEDLHGAVALAIALMMKIADAAPETSAPLEARVIAPQPQLTPPMPAQQIPGPPSPARAARSATDAHVSSPNTVADPRGALSLRASGLFAVGAHSFAASGFHGGLALSVARAIELRAGMLGLFSFSRELANSDGTYRTRALAASVAVCAMLVGRPSLRLRMCTELWAGRLRADGANFDPPLTARLPWSSAALPLELAWQLRAHWALSLAASPVVSLLRAEVVARDAQDTIVARAELPRFSAMLGIGLAYTFSRSTVR